MIVFCAKFKKITNHTENISRSEGTLIHYECINALRMASYLLFSKCYVDYHFFTIFPISVSANFQIIQNIDCHVRSIIIHVLF